MNCGIKKKKELRGKKYINKQKQHALKVEMFALPVSSVSACLTVKGLNLLNLVKHIFKRDERFIQKC